MVERWAPAVVTLAVVALAPACGAQDGAGVVQADWWLAAEPSGTEILVVVYTGSSSCHEFDRVETEEEDDVVAIKAYVADVGGPDCTADETWLSNPIELAEPLGSRALRGCTAPEDGLRAHGLPHDDVDCATLIRPEGI